MFKQIVLLTKTGVSGKTADIKHYFGSVLQEKCLSLTFIPNMYSVLTVTCTFTIMYSVPVHLLNPVLKYFMGSNIMYRSFWVENKQYTY